MGYSAEMLSRPIVGIAQSASGYNNRHRHFPELVEAVHRPGLSQTFAVHTDLLQARLIGAS